MLRFLASTGLALSLFAGCGSDCPDGGAQGSVFCHADNCAPNESVCGGVCSNPLTDRDNCGSCGNVCGDGFTCAGGSCVEACDNGLANCGGTCTNIETDPANCGGCSASDPSFQCAPGETCSNSVCSCDAPKLTCGGACTDPQTDPMHCGATGDCIGVNAGDMCTTEESCINGVCAALKIYRGSLPPTTGRWEFNSSLGLVGANAACEAAWPGSAVCTFAKLQAASMKVPAETLNATDINGTPVTTWWLDEDLAGEGRCNDIAAENVPWSYATAHLNHSGRHVELTAATGAITVTTMDVTCNVMRNVPCCSLVTAP